MSKSALVLLAKGAEELEFVSVANILRRGQVKVTVAGVDGAEPVKCRSDVVILPDVALTEAAAAGPYDAIVLPGGLACAKALVESEKVGDLLKKQEKAGKLIAAICAAPTALKAHSVGLGKRITSYPAMEEEMQKGSLYKYEKSPVVVDGNIITSRGPATAFIFSLTILEQLQGKTMAKQVASDMLYEY